MKHFFTIILIKRSLNPNYCVPIGLLPASNSKFVIEFGIGFLVGVGYSSFHFSRETRSPETHKASAREKTLFLSQKDRRLSSAT